jgi:hypothetical protein
MTCDGRGGTIDVGERVLLVLEVQGGRVGVMPSQEETGNVTLVQRRTSSTSSGDQCKYFATRRLAAMSR